MLAKNQSVLVSEWGKNYISPFAELIPGFLRQASTMAINGRRKRHRTWLAVYLAFAAALGRNWLQFPIKRSRVLFLDTHNGITFLKDRINLIAEIFGIDPKKELQGNLVIHSVKTSPVTCLSFIREMKRMVKERRFDLVVIDSVSVSPNSRDLNNLLGEIYELQEEELFGTVIVTDQTDGETPSCCINSYLTMKPIESNTGHPRYKIEAELLNTKPMDNFNIEFIYPLFRVV